MKNTIDRIKQFDAADKILVVICALIVLSVCWSVWIDETGINLKNENKRLTDSIQSLKSEIEKRDFSIRFRESVIEDLTEQLNETAKRSDSLSIAYRNKIKSNEKTVSIYRRLPVDQRVGVFTKQISGNR